MMSYGYFRNGLYVLDKHCLAAKGVFVFEFWPTEESKRGLAFASKDVGVFYLAGHLMGVLRFQEAQ